MPQPITVAEAAEQTGVPKRTIQAAIARADLKAHKLAAATGAYLIQQRDLDNWIANRKTT